MERDEWMRTDLLKVRTELHRLQSLLREYAAASEEYVSEILAERDDARRQRDELAAALRARSDPSKMTP